MSVPPTEVASPEDTPAPTPKPRLFGLSGSQPNPSPTQTGQEVVAPPSISANAHAVEMPTTPMSDAAAAGATGETNRQRPEQTPMFPAPENHQSANANRMTAPSGAVLKVEATTADKELNAAYKPLLARLRQAGPDLADQLIASQKQWLSARDRITDPTEQIDFVRARTNDLRQRTKFIDRKMKEYDNAHSR